MIEVAHKTENKHSNMDRATVLYPLYTVGEDVVVIGDGRWYGLSGYVVLEVGMRVLVASNAGFLYWFDTVDVAPSRSSYVDPCGLGFFRDLDSIPPK
jgi:hypothetical protein